MKNYYEKIKSLNLNHYKDEIPYYTTAPFRRVESKVVEYLSKDAFVLDIGCGSGRFTIGVAERKFKKVVGLDINNYAIDAANSKAHTLGLDNCFFIVADMTSLPFSDNQFDYVFCPRYSLNALATYGNRKKAVAEMIRVLKPTGVAYIETFNYFYMGKPNLFIRNILRDLYRISRMIFSYLLMREYDGLLLGDITYRANKITNASDGYAHLTSAFEMKLLFPKHVRFRFYSIPQLLGKLKFDPFKYVRYSLWVELKK